MHKKVCVKFVFLFFLFLAAGLVVTSCRKDKRPIIAIVLSGTNDGLDTLKNSFLETLKSSTPDIDKYRIDEYNADFSSKNLSKISTSIMKKEPKLIVSIGLMATEEFSKAISGTRTKVVYATSVKPDNMSRFRANCTGVFFPYDFMDEIEVIRDFYDRIGNIGVIVSDTYKSCSLDIIDKLNSDASSGNVSKKKAYITYINVASKDDIEASLLSLFSTHDGFDTIDCLFIPPDDIVVSNIDTIINIADEYNIPVFAPEAIFLKKGAIASAYRYYEKAGEIMAHQAGEVLRNAYVMNIEKPNAIENGKFYNSTNAESLYGIANGFDIPANINIYTDLSDYSISNKEN